MPGFLKRAEQKLLLNKPGIWSTRTHLVLYYGILFILLLTGLCFLEPTDLRARSTTDYWTGFMIIICVLALTVWLVYLLRFNVFKKYGNIQPLHGLVTFILYFIATGIIILFVFIHPVVESVRANMAFGDEELVQDVNSMNSKLCQLEYNLLNKKWDYDTVAIVKDAKPAEEIVDYDEVHATVVTNTGHSRFYYQLDSVAFDDRLAKTDSLVKLNDTLYLMYNTPNLEFVTTYWVDDHTKEKILNSFEIYNKVFRHPPTTTEKAAIGKDLELLFDKYRYPKNTAYNSAEIEYTDPPYEIIHKKYKVDQISNSVGNIAHKKYNLSEKKISEFIRVFYYLTLGITLLIFIFRHTTVRTFFLSLLSAVLLSILTALVLSFSHSSGTTFLAWMAGYTILFFLGSLAIWSGAKRNVITGVALNLFVFIVPAFPLIVMAWVTEWKQQQYYETYNTYAGFDMDPYLIYAEIGGPVLFLILLATYIGRIYRRWYSMPEH